jgi:DNA topoisomerase-1
VDSADVNAYLKEATGGDFTAKDFRTWVATVEALGELARRQPGATLREKQANVREVVETVAERLGNTVAICKKCYIHPAVIEAGLAGEVLPEAGESPRGLRADERVALKLLRRAARRR